MRAEIEKRRTMGEPGNFRRAIEHYGEYQKIMERLTEEKRPQADEERIFSHYLEGQLYLLMARKENEDHRPDGLKGERMEDSLLVSDSEGECLRPIAWIEEIENYLEFSREHLGVSIDEYNRLEQCKSSSLNRERLSASYMALNFGLTFHVSFLKALESEAEDLDTDAGRKFVLSCYERQAYLEKGLLELHPDEEHREVLSLTYYRVAKSLRKLGGSERLEKALAYSARDVELGEMIVHAAGTEKHRTDLALSLKLGRLIAAELYDQTGEPAYLEQAIAACERIVQLRSANAEENPSEKNQKKLREAEEDYAAITEKRI